MEVEIWSDIACPWCYLGKRRFERALEQFEDRDEVHVIWRSFELDPGAPKDAGEDVASLVARKYGRPREEIVERHEQMTEMAAGEGIEFRFDRARRGNTFDAHRLIHLGASLGLGDETKERLLRAYHGEGVPIGDPEALARVAAEVLPEAEVRATLAGDRFAEDVRTDEALARELDIHAVPAFVVDRRMAVSGAQPPELLVKMLRRAAEPVA
ncbi:MAG TPA: DsbA family oxidoreductase [Solirubrobacteraceae bacterium]|jgi:predicted DsbA family dithiol-disulfide isomerase